MSPWINRGILIVLDGAGAGALPDAGAYGDDGCNTLGNLAETVGLHLPTLGRLGLGNIVRMRGVPPAREPLAAFGRLAQRSAGKDSTVGHWELMGVISPALYPTYPNGFPDEIIQWFAQRTGRGVLANKPASGTAVIEEYFQEHCESGKWIVYTSADSVLQVAAHEDVIPPGELYEACREAADRLIGDGGGETRVLRVIARPFNGEQGSLKRTAGRRDYNTPPPVPTALDVLAERHWPVVTLGKVDSIFAGRGISEAVPTSSNAETLEALREEMSPAKPGLLFANLGDFDTVYGHRNDAEGYAAALGEFDEALAGILDSLGEEDMLVITSDHGCDPTTQSTDHSREYVPVLAYGEQVAGGVDLGTRSSFADVAATICAALGVRPPGFGTSFWHEIVTQPRIGVGVADRERMAWLRRHDLPGWGLSQ